jgi:hypothetical protein
MKEADVAILQLDIDPPSKYVSELNHFITDCKQGSHIICNVPEYFDLIRPQLLRSCMVNIKQEEENWVAWKSIGDPIPIKVNDDAISSQKKEVMISSFFASPIMRIAIYACIIYIYVRNS